MNYSELLKYPLTLLSLTICILVLKWFGMVGPIRKLGEAEFGEIQTKANTDFERRLGTLETVLFKDSAAPTLTDSSVMNQVTISQNVISDNADHVVAFQQQLEKTTDNANKTEGWIFIGNFDKTWRSRFFKTESGDQPRPQDIAPGDNLILLGNMVARQDLPNNDVNYYKAVPSTGLLVRNTKVVVEEAPVLIDRQVLKQYWVKVKQL